MDSLWGHVIYRISTDQLRLFQLKRGLDHKSSLKDFARLYHLALRRAERVCGSSSTVLIIYFDCLLFSDDSFCGFGLGGGGGGFGFGGRAGLETKISFLDCCISLLCNFICLGSTFLIQLLIFWNTSIAHATRHTCHSLNQLSIFLYNFLICHRPIINTNP